MRGEKNSKKFPGDGENRARFPHVRLKAEMSRRTNSKT
jgi:hypothetical protein